MVQVDLGLFGRAGMRELLEGGDDGADAVDTLDDEPNGLRSVGSQVVQIDVAGGLLHSFASWIAPDAVERLEEVVDRLSDELGAVGHELQRGFVLGRHARGQWAYGLEPLRFSQPEHGALASPRLSRQSRHRDVE